MDDKIIGFLGTLLIQSSYLPQTIKIFRTKNVKGISPIFLGMVFIGLVLFEWYSIRINDLVYIVSNVFGMLNCGTTLVAYFVFKKKTSGYAD